MTWLHFFWDGFSRVISANYGWLEYTVCGRAHYMVEGQAHYEVGGRLQYKVDDDRANQ